MRSVIALGAAIAQIGVEIGVADVVAVRLHHGEIDAEILGAGTDRGRGEDLPVGGGLGCRDRYGFRSGRGHACRSGLHDLFHAGRLCLGLPLDRSFGSHRRGLGGVALDFDHHQRRADRHHLADFAGQLDHHAGDGRFHLDRGLVGHHVGDLLVLRHLVADLDVPGDDLGLGNAFADIGQAEGEACHAGQSFRIFLRAVPMRTGPGK